MRRKWFFVSIGAAGAGLLASYMLFAVFARRPLSLSESLIISAALLRALPSPSSTGETWLSTVELARQALASPVSKDSFVVAGRRYELPLPPYSVQHPNCENAYITFATRAQLGTYYTTTLPEVGWDYIEQMGSGRFFRKNNTQLLVTQIFHQGTRISELTVSINDVNSTNTNR